MSKKCCERCRHFNPSEGSRVIGNGLDWIKCDLLYVDAKYFLDSKTFSCSEFKKRKIKIKGE